MAGRIYGWTGALTNCAGSIWRQKGPSVSPPIEISVESWWKARSTTQHRELPEVHTIINAFDTADERDALKAQVANLEKRLAVAVKWMEENQYAQNHAYPVCYGCNSASWEKCEEGCEYQHALRVAKEEE